MLGVHRGFAISWKSSYRYFAAWLIWMISFGRISHEAFDLFKGGFAGFSSAEIDGVKLDQVGIKPVLAHSPPSGIERIHQRPVRKGSIPEVKNLFCDWREVVSQEKFL